MEILLQILVGFVPAVIGFLAARSLARTRLFLRYGFLRALLGPYGRVQIVTPSIEVGEFAYAKDGCRLTSRGPRNVLFMPMAEARAIAELTDLLRKINRKATIELVTAGAQDPRMPTFSVGGPSVNAYSAGVLATAFPDFRLEHPQAARARWGGMAFEAQYNAADELVRDHGFVFVTRTSRQAPCVVLCGVFAFGSAMAVEALAAAGRQSPLAGLFRSGEKGFVAVEGRVIGLDTVDVTVEVCRVLPSG
ncbi:hypothetical protein ACIPYS_14185 [Kitasatospora sp. NPDC089913]|uniref:hypothetical protein n=1 Tax=Streptomycetaceae TaxID=2062 RepID=UPI00087D1CA9|nr:hypothetical protein [Streptomyces sp. TLI_053]SDT50209.1 hypothetical protein SAMN05216371_2573 [Streptomyces sp. TLI_053]